MPKTVTPMLHVPDVERTLRWYESVGFAILDSGKEDGETVWGMAAYGDGRVMFSAGGRPSNAHRREVDLYIETPDVDALYERLKDRVDVFEGPHDTFYGMREFIIRDVNRFWITFGEPSRAAEGNR